MFEGDGRRYYLSKNHIKKLKMHRFEMLFILTAAEQEEEPEWVEVMVDILLSLLSQPSRHIRLVCRTVFSSICPHLNLAALNAILDVSETSIVVQIHFRNSFHWSVLVMNLFNKI